MRGATGRPGGRSWLSVEAGASVLASTARKGELMWKEVVLATGLGLSMVLNVGLMTERKRLAQAVKEKVDLPSPAAIQLKLNELEPQTRLKVDGKIGPLTLEKWNRIYIEQSAKNASKGFYK